MSGILLMTVGNSYASAPVNLTVPVITGTASLGQTLTTSNGTWSGSPAPAFTYQWQRVTTNIGGATSSTYVVVSADVGNTLRCVVTATNILGAVSANSANTATVTLPAVGSALGGGFYAGQIGVSSVATHNLIVSPRSSGQLANVYKNSNSDTPGATSAIDGPANTAAQVADGNSTVYPCGHFCNDLSTGGQTDWYMPATNELEICYYNLKPGTNNNDTSSGINPNAVPARASNYTSGNPAQTSSASFVVTTGAERFSESGYWCSDQNSASTAKKQRFQNTYQGGYQGVSNKGYGSNIVRAVRRVAV